MLNVLNIEAVNRVALIRNSAAAISFDAGAT